MRKHKSAQISQSFPIADFLDLFDSSTRPFPSFFSFPLIVGYFCLNKSFLGVLGLLVPAILGVYTQTVWWGRSTGAP